MSTGRRRRSPAASETGGPVTGMFGTAAGYALAAIMAGTLNLIMYFPWIIVAAVIVSLALGLFLPYITRM